MVQLTPAQLQHNGGMPFAACRRSAQRTLSRSAGTVQVLCKAKQSRAATTAAVASLEVAAPVDPVTTGLEGTNNRPGVLNMAKYRALVLDSSYCPIEVVNWQKSLCMDLYDKVDVLEYHDGIYVNSAYSQFLIPSVLRVRFYVQQRRSGGSSRVAINRRNVFLRDNNACQYCGSRHDLTIDHVLPLSRGGDWSWGNLVTACYGCNSKKGAKTLKQLGWKLRKKPAEPSPYDLGIVCGGAIDIHSPPKEWMDYLAPFLEKRQQQQQQRRA